VESKNKTGVVMGLESAEGHVVFHMAEDRPYLDRTNRQLTPSLFIGQVLAGLTAVLL
jgi:hypothetical protein